MIQIERMYTLPQKSAEGSRVRISLRRAYHKLLELPTGGKGLKRSLPGGEIVRILPAYRYTKWNPAKASGAGSKVNTFPVGPTQRPKSRE